MISFVSGREAAILRKASISRSAPFTRVKPAEKQNDFAGAQSVSRFERAFLGQAPVIGH